MASPAAATRKNTARKKGEQMSEHLKDSLTLAESKGLLAGGRTLTIRGRMPEALVAEAKRKTGIKSDSKLLEAALASVAVADDFGAWLISQRGTVNPDLDLEF